MQAAALKFQHLLLNKTFIKSGSTLHLPWTDDTEHKPTVSCNETIEEIRTQPLRMNSTLISSFPWYTGAIKDYQKFSGKVLAAHIIVTALH